MTDAASTRKPPLRGPLAPLASSIYRAVITRKNRRFDTGKGVVTFDRPVISVGNLSVGGTGKTPMVLSIARLLRSNGFNPCIAMRGYGKGRAQGLDSDEAQIYSRALPDLPIVAQPNRINGLISLFGTPDGQGVNAIILDDGFQHRQIGRQLDIVLVDATRPPFGDKLLPAGWLREPLASLSRAHAAVVTHAEAVTRTDAIEIETRLWNFLPKGIVAVCRHAWTGLVLPGTSDPAPVSWLHGKRLHAACAIGNPAPFLDAAAKAVGFEGEVVGTTILPDHADFTPQAISRLRVDLTANRAQALLVTEKDWSKLQGLPEDTFSCPVVRPVLDLSFDRHQAPLERAILDCVSLFKDDDS